MCRGHVSGEGMVCVWNEKTGVAAGLWAREWGKWEKVMASSAVPYAQSC